MAAPARCFTSDAERIRHRRAFLDRAPSRADDLELALRAMVESYERLMRVMPEGTASHRLAAGSFGKAPEVARQILEGR